MEFVGVARRWREPASQLLALWIASAVAIGALSESTPAGQRYPMAVPAAALVAALGGVDAMVFTAGIGENSRSLRERVFSRDAAWLGVAFDAEANRANGPRISTAGSRASAWVIPTNEELMIARHARRVLAAA